MIRFSAVGYVLGQFLLVLAATMLAPLPFTFFGASGDARAMGLSIACTVGAGLALFAACRRPTTELTLREGLLLVCVVWFCVSLFGGLPFVFSPHFPTFTDAMYESVSGFTTTGASILPEVEVLPSDIQFWRHFSHWLGGMGIVLLGVAILPLLGLGGMHLYRAEFSGAKSEKLKPRITEAAMSLWRIYFALTAAQTVALKVAGMTWYEAVCHSMSTLGTGGFSTRTASVAGFNNPAVEYIIILFMILAGTNFTCHYRLWVERRPGGFFGDVELRAWVAIILLCSLAITWSRLTQQPQPLERAFRDSLFQVTSMIATCGFATADFDKWLPFPQLLLIAVMFCGGCTGSTSGGFKVARVLLLFKVVGREFLRMIERRAVVAIRLGGKTIPEPAIQNLLNLIYLALIVNFASSLLLTATGVDPLSSITAVAANMFGVGPGLREVGPAANYSKLPALAKWVLMGDMLAGRLEFYTLLVILTPSFWRK
ncbi:MAG: hypothetical protein JNK48_30425 [Bryobacterales bacterium]|nr:hypothetical protein [Bryobacterales bacterium]